MSKALTFLADQEFRIMVASDKTSDEEVIWKFIDISKRVGNDLE